MAATCERSSRGACLRVPDNMAVTPHIYRVPILENREMQAIIFVETFGNTGNRFLVNSQTRLTIYNLFGMNV
jgi:hypothetical protein